MFEKQPDKQRRSVVEKKFIGNFLKDLTNDNQIPKEESHVKVGLTLNSDENIEEHAQTERKRGNSFIDRLSIFSTGSKVPIPKIVEKAIVSPYVKVIDENTGKPKWVEDKVSDELLSSRGKRASNSNLKIVEKNEIISPKNKNEKNGEILNFSKNIQNSEEKKM